MRRFHTMALALGLAVVGHTGCSAVLDWSGADDARCGDGALDPGEECDDGNLTAGDGCDPRCVFEICGDGVAVAGEACDGADLRGESCETLGYSGGVLSCNTGCTFDATSCLNVCGDAIINTGEACDDGNVAPADGCNGLCEIERGWICAGAPSICQQTCGNGLLDTGEFCDDGNATIWDGCDNCLATDLQISLPGAGDQIQPDVAVAADGAAVAMVWVGDDPNTPGNRGIYAAVLAADGTLGNTFAVSRTEAATFSPPRIARRPEGSFVVTWSNDSLNGGVFTRRFDAAGVLSQEFNVSVSGTGPRVGVAADNSYVVLWDAGNRVYRAARVTASGVSMHWSQVDYSIGSMFSASDYSLTVADDASFTLVYSIDPAVAAVRHDGDGVFVGTGSVIAFSAWANFPLPLAAAGLPDGGLVVAFSSNFDDTGPLDEHDIMAQRLDASLQKVGPLVYVAQTVISDQYASSIAVDGAGNYVVSWTSQDGDVDGVYARRFDSSFAPTSDEFIVNQFTTGPQKLPQVALAADGRAAFVWGSADQDGDLGGIFGQRFDTANAIFGANAW